MNDAISRSAVRDQLRDYLEQEICGENRNVSDVGVGLEIALNTVKGAPALDAVPVVRCKDCRWHDSAFSACSKSGLCVTHDFYCAIGERE